MTDPVQPSADAPEAPSPQSREFLLDHEILGIDSTEKITVSLATDADVLDAIIHDRPFPMRRDGRIEMGRIALETGAGKNVTFAAGEVSVSLHASAGFKTGIGVYDKAGDALSSLQLERTPGLVLAADSKPDARYLVMLWGYNVSGSFSGSHPVGAIGSLTFGADADRDRLYAVMHRLNAGAGAHSAIADTAASWRLPRHVRQADDLKPGTWLIVEADGSLALHVAAHIGYDLDFVRQARLLGVTHELGAKIDLGIKTTIGYEVSGKYLIVVGRETESATVRLQLFKQNNRGLSFGLNLTAGVTGQADLPEKADEFVQSVFGVHGLQVVKDLQCIEQWTDPSKDLGETVARLANKTGLELLRNATGIDPTKEFDLAHSLMTDVLKKWNALPGQAAAAIWGILGRVNEAGAADFHMFLKALADPDPKKRTAEIGKALQDVTFGDTPRGQFLAAIAGDGLLALGDRLDEVQKIAAETQAVLDGGIIRKLQAFISEKLDLDEVLQAATQTDFDALDEWLIRRLADFLDRQFDFSDLDEIKNAIHLVIKKGQEIYGQARQALNKRYSFDLAANYQRTTTQTALLDVNFDLNEAGACSLMEDVVVRSNMDDLLIRQVAGVTLNQAVLSHEVQRKGKVQVHMPFLDAATEHINDSLAKVTAEEDAGRVLVYAVDASDTVTATNRYKSQLSLMGSLRVRDGRFDTTAAEGKSVSYQLLQVKRNMKLIDFEQRVSPFIREHLMDEFPDGEPSLQTFYIDLGRMVASAVGDGAGKFGDVALSMHVALPGSVLAAWFQPKTPADLRRDSMNLSRRLQARLKWLLPAYFFQELGNMQPNPSAAALLVWSAIPISTSVEFREGSILQFNTDRDVFWNYPDIDLRRAVASGRQTMENLAPILEVARQRLVDAGDPANAAFFGPEQTGSFLRMALSGPGDTLLQQLLFTESQMVTGAAKALADIQAGLSEMAGAPARAIARLAGFGAALTDTFNKKLTSVYGNDSLRAMSSMLLAEASKAIDPVLSATPSDALLSIIVLKESRTFQLADFLSGRLPPSDQIVLTQTLVHQDRQ
ncbi:MAG: hypothetical protein ABSC02_09650 [Acidobacteriota bacterium]|jgi:hypothetical protein